MAPKRKKQRTEKKAPVPLDLDAAYGYATEDVAACVDWSALQSAFDELTEPRMWALKLTHGKVAAKLPLRLAEAAAAKAKRVPLLEAMGAGAGAKADSAGSAPEAGPQFVVSSRMTWRAVEGKGRGWFVDESLPAGTLVLVDRPLCGVLDVEWRGQPWAECDSSDTTALGNRLAGKVSKSLCTVLAPLHPAEGTPVPEKEKKEEEDESEDEEEKAMEEAMEEAAKVAWEPVDWLSQPQKERLKAVVRLNSLGFYTASELLCHSGNFTALTGAGLFALASGFNHSCEPNVARFSLGDVTGFVTNRPVEKGDELCISYIEAELLSAPKSLRSQSLDRDFKCGCARCTAEGKVADAPQRRYLNVDAQVQAQLSLLAPADRIEAVETALRGELMGEDEEEEEEDKDAGPAVVLGKDAQELRVVHALALMQTGKHAAALAVWRKLAAFTCKHCPPYDEGLAVYATQAALCALAADPKEEGCGPEAATRYVASAANSHRASTGCGAALFKWRYQMEVGIAEVPIQTKQAFWEVVEAVIEAAAKPGKAPVPWEEAVSAWSFREEEIPEAISGPLEAGSAASSSAGPAKL